ncbi:hypothetical protein EIP75_21525 [Aquabacterium soli]|uniref:protein adenylyltransferase n=1 Tax=Aquabacterium soli TaxID=2493092 RepID=A0A426V2M0_9BURK|nr:Fic family protein [Aquabacterium soli]RRS01159.1 hypothetical protein EIP75_21525 [Aquabacterium soli]
MSSALRDENGVFRNKLGITDARELKAAEYSLTSMRMAELEAGRTPPLPQSFGLDRLRAIHGNLFQDVYEWAGKLRTTPSSKAAENGLVSVFENPDKLVSSWDKLAERTQAFAVATGLTVKQKREELTGIYIEANRIHPFPEGNGRSLQTFMKQLAREQGLELDFTRATAREWNQASAISGTHGHLVERQYLIPEPPDAGPITKIIEQIARPARALAFEKLPEAEACAKFPELRTAYDGLRAIENQVKQREGYGPKQVADYMEHVREAFVKRLDEPNPIERVRQVSPGRER